MTPREKNFRDVQIGRNIARLRGDRTQQSVAEEMRAWGWRWSQATVWSVETGERPLKYWEVVDLARVLEVPVEAFTSESELMDELWAAENEHSESVGELMTASILYLESQEELRQVLRRAEESGEVPEERLARVRVLLATPLEAFAGGAQSEMLAALISELVAVDADASGATLQGFVSYLRTVAQEGERGVDPEA